MTSRIIRAAAGAPKLPGVAWRRLLYVSTALAAMACAGGATRPAWGQASVAVSGDVFYPGVVSSPHWTLSFPGLLYVGFNDPNTTGILTISGGGSVSDNIGYIGWGSGTTGVVSVSGMDGGGNASAWTNSGSLNVGYFGNGTLTVAAGGKVSASMVELATTGAGTLNLNGDAVSGRGVLEAGYVAKGPGAGTLSLDGGILRATGDASDFLRGFGVVTAGAEGVWIDSNGHDIKVGPSTAFAGSSSFHKIGSGVLMLTGDSSGFAGIVRVNAGTLDIAQGGRLGGSSGAIGTGLGDTGAVTVSGADGSGNGSAWVNAGALQVGVAGNGTLTAAGGGTVSAATVELASAATGVGTLNLAGSALSGRGVLEAGHVARGLGGATLNLDGGLLRAAGDESDFLRGFGAVTAGPEGVWIDSNGHDIGIGASTTFAGASSLHKIGVGALTLTGDSSGFTGVTTVSGGTLLVGDGSGVGRLGGAVDVGVGGVLGGSGTIFGAATIAGVLSAGNSAGTLTFADRLTLSAGAMSVFELNSPGVVGGAGAGGNDLVVVGGDLALGGALEARVAAAGYYRLFNYGGTLSGAFAGGVVTGSGGFTPVTDTPDLQYGIPGQVNLSVLASGQAMQFWDGADHTGNGVVDGGAGVWSAGGANWTGRPGEAGINGLWGGSVGVFAGAGGGIVTVAGTQTFDTLQVSANGYALQGGALAIGASGGGTLNIDSGVSVTIASAIADGAGSALRKTGGGTLVLSGANAYTGGTVVTAGVLIGGAAAIRGDLANAGTVIFDQVGDAGFSGDIAGYGGANGAMVKRGAGTLTLAGTSSLDWTVAAGGLTTEAQRFTGNATIAAGATLTFAQTADAAYAGVLSGAGGFGLAGSGMLTLTGDSSAFAGSTTVGPGVALIVANALGGAIAVAPGAVLGGGGDLGWRGRTVAIAAGGMHAPGAAQAVLGDYLNHGTLRIAATPATASRITVAGAVDIAGATLDLMLSSADAASWAVFTGPYTIIDKRSAGAVTGTFGRVTQNLLFLDVRLDYDGGDGNDVTLALDRNDVRFASIGRTPNQQAAAAAVDALGNSNPLWRAIALGHDPDLVRKNFDALAGEIHASARTALIEDSRFLRGAVNDRLRAAFATAGASRAPVMAYAGRETPLAVAPDQDGAVVWGHGFGSWGGSDGDGNAAALDRSIAGVLVGTDGVAGDWRGGFMAGYSRSRFSAPERAASGDSDNYHVGLYGGSQWGHLAFRSGLAYTWHQFDTHRAVVLPSAASHPAARYHAGTAQVFGEFGYGVGAGALAFEPFANLAYVDLHGGDFTEQGGVAALTANSATTSVTFTTLGLRAASDLSLGDTSATLRAILGWRHAFGDTIPTMTHSFAGSSAFTITGAPIARDGAVVEAGLDLNLSLNAKIGVAYTGQIAPHAHDHGFKANLAVKF